MAGQTDLATLVVKLEAETAKYQKQLDDAIGQLKKFNKDTNDTVNEIAKTLAELFALKEIGEFVANLAEADDQLGKFAQSIGVSTEALSELTYAAKASGVQDFDKDLEHLARTASEAAVGNNAASASFKSIGVSVTDANGKLKPADQLLGEIADNISQYSDGLAKTNVVQQLFGKNAAALIPLFNQGAKGIQALRDEAKELGISLGGDTVQAATEFDDSLTRLKAAGEGAGQAVLRELLPPLTDLATLLLGDLKDAGSDAGDGLQIFGTVVKGIVAISSTALEVLKDLGVAIAANFALMNQLAHLNLSGAKAVLQGFTDDISKNAEHTQALIDKLTESAEDAKKKAAEAAAGASSGGSGPGGKDLVPIDAASLDMLTKYGQSLQQNLVTLDLTAADVTKYRLEAGDLSIALKKSGDEGKAAADKILFFAEALDLRKAQDAVEKMSLSILQLGNNSAKAAAAAFDLQNKALLKTIGTNPADPYVKIVANLRALTVAQAQYNDLQVAGARSQQQYSDTQLEIERKLSNGQIDQLEAQKELDAARDTEIAQYSQIVAQIQKLADKYGSQLPKLKDDADKATQSLKDLQNNTKIKQENIQAIEQLDIQMQQLAGHTADAAIAQFDLQNKQLASNLQSAGTDAQKQTFENIRQATVYQATFNQLLSAQQDINDSLSRQLDEINRKQSAGQLTDLDAEKAANDARAQAVVQLQGIDNALTAIGQNSGIDQLQKQAAASVNATKNLNAQTDQLAKTLRTDLSDDASNAFDEFVTGAKSAGDAVYDLLTDVEKQLVSLASKQLFQSLFAAPDSSGSGGGAFGGVAGFLAGLFTSGGGKASGGDVSAGVPYTVGENGPETFVPPVDGNIKPTNWGKGVTVQNHFLISAPQGSVSRATQTQIAASAMRGLTAANLRNN